MNNNNSQSRKYLITINNPIEKGIDNQEFLRRLQSLKGLVYVCKSEEIGNETQQHHMHLFVIYKNPKRFSTIKKLFPEAHFDNVLGSNKQNRDYVLKIGKWEGSAKEDTRIDGTQIEWGEFPMERCGSNPKLDLLYELIKDGKTNYEIIDAYPEYMLNITMIEQCRRILQQKEFADELRNVEVTYIFGKTGAGKTRSVMDAYSYSNVFRVTDYQHPFDTYEGQDVILFEEFHSSLKITDILNYLDIYPLKLPARYSDKIACYTKVYITSNIPLESQYTDIQEYKPETWRAFLRRINSVEHYVNIGKKLVYDSVDDYLNRNSPTAKKPTVIDNRPSVDENADFSQVTLENIIPFETKNN